jgi:flagella basal body P-ring formation protein FlgA
MVSALHRTIKPKRTLAVTFIVAVVAALALPGHALAADGVRSLAAGEVRKLVESYVDGQLAGSEDHWRVGAIRVSGDPQVPTGPLTMSVSHGRGVELVGPTVLHLRVEGPSGYERRLRITTVIDRDTPVVVARRDLERGAVLGKADLGVEYRPLRSLPNDAATTPDGVVAKQLTRPVSAGAVLRAGLLAEVPVVSRGTQVSLVAMRGALRITTPGIVREDGGAGQMVSVVNPASGKVVNGRVIDGKTVEVMF